LRYDNLNKVSRIVAGLAIGEIAGQTQVSVATLRAWERRHGFPAPERLPSGHRRYTERHIEQIRAVLRERDAGLSLDAAIARVRASERAPERSIFAGLRRYRPELPVHVRSKRAMLAISRAIEDECCARAETPVLIGSFQREKFYRQSESRWREFARTAAATVAIADFGRTRLRSRAPNEITAVADAPILREWAIVCDAEDATGCLAGVERARTRVSQPREFEAIWSADPEVVRVAAEIGIAIAQASELRLASVAEQLTARVPAEAGRTIIRATALTDRIITYLDEHGHP
jgi:DNA-binding transcriptional MerR regulator